VQLKLERPNRTQNINGIRLKDGVLDNAYISFWVYESKVWCLNKHQKSNQTKTLWHKTRPHQQMNSTWSRSILVGASRRRWNADDGKK
jgi:hypothetical protein